MIPGIDLVGRVVRSEPADFAPGDQVALNGFGLGEVHYGGYAGMWRGKSDWLAPLPEGITPRQAIPPCFAYWRWSVMASNRVMATFWLLIRHRLGNGANRAA
jgi:NADPH:quinone reductase-like Zn-dependent oxidoreductase